MEFEIEINGKLYKGKVERTEKDKLSIVLDSGTYDVELLSQKDDDSVFF